MSKWYSPRIWWAWLNGEEVHSPEAFEMDPEEGARVTPPLEPGEASPSDDPDGGVYTLRSSEGEAGRLVIIRSRPRSMEDASVVADKIKQRLPVTINLEGVEEATARRIVDFLVGVAYALDGSTKKIGRAVFLCSPFHIPIQELQMERPARDRLFVEQEIEPERATL